ncbi:DNA replication factor Cdt1 C-terminal domain-containing protein [Aspergillus stella-maris]|uniref:DNA replication factor Cdt1 C-terminal domain-containing protein n=1 Tax=Aspergillus stella-maris TaxID=1810926 RepID=UPI003CCE3D6D
MPRTSTRASTAASRARLPRSQTQPGISSFARATKPGLRSVVGSVKEGKTLNSNSTEQSQAGSLPVSPSKKRKLSELANVGAVSVSVTEVGKSEENANADLTLTPSKTLKFSSLQLSTPKRSSRSGHYVVSEEQEDGNEDENTTQAVSPSRKARDARIAAGAGIEISSEPLAEEDENDNDDVFAPSTPSKSLARSRTIATPKSRAGTLRRTQSTLSTLSKTLPPASRQTARVHPPARPAAVEELVRLHSSFLKALTIHAAHKGVMAPADLREFLPSIERIWKKRKVVVKDLQRLLWVWKTGQGECGFRLANHGLGRVCLERVGGRSEKVDDEGALQGVFEEKVEGLWKEALEVAGGDEKKVDFLATVGLANIEESLAPFTAFRKGQQRLQDLKGGIIKMKMGALLAESAEESSGTSPVKRDATTSRRQGLLDRIKNKQLRQLKLPPPPSKDVLLRRAAAGRIEEVAAVLALLRPAGYVGSGPLARMAAQRTPFCLETIVRNVQDSTRNPISGKEVEACLDILSREDVAGHWVNIVVVSQLKSVVLKSCADVQLKELGPKVAQLDL